MVATKLSKSMTLIILLLKYIASMLVDVLSIPLHFNLVDSEAGVGKSYGMSPCLVVEIEWVWVITFSGQ